MSISYRWIKLYIEILDDPKMGLLPNHLWRRTIEFFLMAGECGKGGALGSVPEIAWRLRVGEADLLQALRSLEEIGIVHCTQENIWVVSKFADRQAAEPPRERTEAYRKREHQRASNEVVTIRDTEEIRIDKNRGDKNREESVQQMAERLTGLIMSPADIPTLKTWERDGVTEEDIRDALQWRVDNGRPPVKTIHQLEAGVHTSYSKRVQGSNARSNGRGAKKGTNVEHKPEDYTGGKYAAWIETGSDAEEA